MGRLSGKFLIMGNRHCGTARLLGSAHVQPTCLLRRCKPVRYTLGDVMDWDVLAAAMEVESCAKAYIWPCRRESEPLRGVLSDYFAAAGCKTLQFVADDHNSPPSTRSSPLLIEYKEFVAIDVCADLVLGQLCGHSLTVHRSNGRGLYDVKGN